MQIPVEVPFRVGSLHDRLVAAGARVVDEDIGAAKLCFRGTHDLGGGFGQRNIAGDRHHADAMGLADRLRDPIEPRFISRGEYEIHALGREAFGDCKTDADAAACDDRNFALKSEFHGAVRPLDVFLATRLHARQSD
jgi:hypothetical protein